MLHLCSTCSEAEGVRTEQRGEMLRRRQQRNCHPTLTHCLRCMPVCVSVCVCVHAAAYSSCHVVHQLHLTLLIWLSSRLRAAQSARSHSHLTSDAHTHSNTHPTAKQTLDQLTLSSAVDVLPSNPIHSSQTAVSMARGCHCNTTQSPNTVQHNTCPRHAIAVRLTSCQPRS